MGGVGWGGSGADGGGGRVVPRVLHASELKHLYRVKKSRNLVSQDGSHNDDADCDGCGDDFNDDDDDDDDDVDDDDDGSDDGSDKDDNGNNDDDKDDVNDDKIDNNNTGYSFTRSCCGTSSKLLSS